jgi:hypothetical protein
MVENRGRWLWEIFGGADRVLLGSPSKVHLGTGWKGFQWREGLTPTLGTGWSGLLGVTHGMIARTRNTANKTK